MTAGLPSQGVASAPSDCIICPAGKGRAKGLPQPPHVQIGDWCKTKRNNRARCWHFRPSEGQPSKAPPLGPIGTYLGPIHEVDVTTRFVAALVPHPADATLLVWVNVWSSRNAAGFPASVYFCDLVDQDELAEWTRHGWENRSLQ